jgi:hypothetical protein
VVDTFGMLYNDVVSYRGYIASASKGKGKFHPRTGYEDPEGELM